LTLPGKPVRRAVVPARADLNTPNVVEQTIRSGRAQRHHSWPGTNFTDDTAARVVVEEGHSAFMILTRDFFQTFTDRPIGDPAVTVSVATAVFLDSREAVDGAVAAGIAAGGAEAQPATDYGFMYQRQLTDPDGNVLVFGWMDPVAAEQDPEAFASQQA
jgi:predicted lactoylglutathione lyase